jgi:formylglycine-generating enzyme required for sulfatase activity
LRTEISYYPYFKPMKSEDWLMFREDSTATLWFYDYEEEIWVDPFDKTTANPSSGQESSANKAGDTFTVPDLSLGMLWVEPGIFEMGSPTSETGRSPDETQHQVTLTTGFWLGKYEVTQAQWEKVMGGNPSYFKGANRPVERVSWNSVTSFCDKLTEQESEAGRLPVGMAYQLPTDAQWEYACRAGTNTAYSWGNSITASNANYSHFISETRDVGQYAANPWGFHDMHGNVWEWCADWYGAYPTGAVSDPVGPADGSLRVWRGGSWLNSASFARSAFRSGGVPARSDGSLGFRLSLRPTEAEPQDSSENKAGDTYTIPDLSLEMLWVEPGTFIRDSQQVTLTEGFHLGKHEVTQAQWEKVMGSNPSLFKGANRPVERVSWNSVTSFCDKLTALEHTAGRLPVGMAYQLPTEAQWEYACRAGTKTVFSFGDSLTSDQANIRGGPNETTDVGKYPDNPWGFHDMHGNVWEWCADWYGDYPTGAARDPVGPADGSLRVLRGGSWRYTADLARSADRDWDGPAYGDYALGFRLSLRPASK